MPTLSERIVDACEATRKLTAEQSWAWACANGWKNPHGKGGGGGYLAWCAVGASLRVHMASDARLSLAFSQPQKLALSRFRLGNASVPRISDDARRLGLVAKTPAPGNLVIVEVRSKGENGTIPAWAGKRSHIGIVVSVEEDKAGKPVAVRCSEANLGGKNVPAYRRPLTPGPTARERVLECHDLEVYAAQLGLYDLVRDELRTKEEPMAAPIEPTEPHDEADEMDDLPLSDDVFTEGHEFLGEVADGDGRTLVLRCVACDASGGYQCVEALPDGTAGSRIYESDEWLPTGAI